MLQLSGLFKRCLQPEIKHMTHPGTQDLLRLYLQYTDALFL